MTKILVVDDMAIFREPLAATLRQNGFAVTTAVNGQEALRAARQDVPDLILLDGAMPVMDGLVFCQHKIADVRLREIPVIMLTAIADRAIVQKAVQYGVEDYLLKSQFSTEELLGRIDKQLRRSAAANALLSAEGDDAAAGAPPKETDQEQAMTAERALACVREHMQLRSIKPVLQHVLALTRSATSSFDDIAGAIRQDQALAVKVMQVANSSFYRTGKPVTSLREAEQRLGLSGIRNITAAILAIEEFADATPAGIVPQRFWEHALATAILSERIGEVVAAPNPPDLFLSGLLHDLGRLILSDVLSGHYARIIDDARTQQIRLEDLERQRFHLTHADITRELLLQWRMPPHVVEAAVLHHVPVMRLSTVAKAPSAAMSVALANAIAHALLLGDSGSEALYPVRHLASALGLATRAIDTLAAEAVDKTSDATLFYASRSDSRTLPPLAMSIGDAKQQHPRVLVPDPCPSILQPVALMLEQLRWLDRAEPNVALIGGDNDAQVGSLLHALAKLPRGNREPLGIVWLSEPGQRSEIDTQDRRIVRQEMPCRYQQIVEQIRLAAQSQPVPAG